MRQSNLFSLGLPDQTLTSPTRKRGNSNPRLRVGLASRGFVRQSLPQEDPGPPHPGRSEWTCDGRSGGAARDHAAWPRGHPLFRGVGVGLATRRRHPHAAGASRSDPPQRAGTDPGSPACLDRDAARGHPGAGLSPRGRGAEGTGVDRGARLPGRDTTERPDRDVPGTGPRAKGLRVSSRALRGLTARSPNLALADS